MKQFGENYTGRVMCPSRQEFYNILQTILKYFNNNFAS